MASATERRKAKRDLPKPSHHTKQPHPIRILSIDGGGIRGIIPAVVLCKLEEKIHSISGDPEARLADYFDIVAGTSTGGILSAMYLCPSPKDPTRPRFSATDALQLYVRHGGNIFETSIWRNIETLNGFIDEKYSATYLEGLLESYVSNLKLSELLKPCIMTSYDIERRCPHYFRQHKARRDANKDFLVKDVARSTSAAPTYFEAARCATLGDSGRSYALVDGGVIVNNPALVAFTDASKMYGLHGDASDGVVLLSLGTGAANKAYGYKEARDWGVAQWIRPLIDIMMDGVAEVVDEQLEELFSKGCLGREDDACRPRRYLRIQPVLSDFPEVQPAMDCATPENIAALLKVGATVAKLFDAELEQLARWLVASGKEPPIVVAMPSEPPTNTSAAVCQGNEEQQGEEVQLATELQEWVMVRGEDT